MSRVTINDIAKRAGVSIGAVSFALNGRKGVSSETRERVIRVADELGWAPSSAARSLAEAKTNTFGFVLARNPRTLGVESFYMQFIAGIEVELQERGYGLLLQVVPSLDDELETLAAWSASRHVDGVFVVDVEVGDPRIELLSKPGALPALVVGDPSMAGDLTSVWTDDATSMRESLRYLSTLGHRRIVRVSGLSSLAHTAIRDAAFTDEVARLGIDGTIVSTDYTVNEGAAATRRVLASQDRPTALVFDNDVMALAGLGVANEMGLNVPDDVSIVAWDDSTVCQYTYPKLTALSHDVVAFGSHAARRLFGVLAGAPSEAHLDSTPTLTPRGSTGRAPAAS